MCACVCVCVSMCIQGYRVIVPFFFFAIVYRNNKGVNVYMCMYFSHTALSRALAQLYIDRDIFTGKIFRL